MGDSFRLRRAAAQRGAQPWPRHYACQNHHSQNSGQRADPAKVRRAGTAQFSLPRAHLIITELRDGIVYIF